MHNFIAIDFETATRSRDSACSIGVAVVEKGRITDTYSSLIRPPQLTFDDDLIGIHGITADAVADAPSFADVWPEVERRCKHGIIVAHNSSFDIGVAHACVANTANSWLPDRYLCTVRVAQAVLPGLPNHKLRTLANLFGLHLDHHDAASDAQACAEIAIRLFRLAGDELVQELSRDIEDFQSSHEHSAPFDEAAIRMALMPYVKVTTHLDSEILVEPAPPDGRFEGQKFVFTGELTYLDRDKAKAIVEEQGGRAMTSVSKKTDIVVVGDEVMDAYEQGGKTTGKLSKAISVRDQGAEIRIIKESEFIRMIGFDLTDSTSGLVA